VCVCGPATGQSGGAVSYPPPPPHRVHSGVRTESAAASVQQSRSFARRTCRDRHLQTCLGAIPCFGVFVTYHSLFLWRGDRNWRRYRCSGRMRLIRTCLAKALRSLDTSAPWLTPLATQFSLRFPLSQLARYGASAAPDPEPREVLEYDVCIVGAGPAGLAAAIRLKQVNLFFWFFVLYINVLVQMVCCPLCVLYVSSNEKAI
jgi:hypothetical protein